MKWVKRGCWVAAWGCWVWLGVGLHRELPRDLQYVAPLSNQTLPFPLGFVGDTHDVAVWVQTGGGKAGDQPAVLLVDGETGALRRSVLAPDVEDLRLGRHATEHGRVFAVKEPTTKAAGLFALDLARAEWRPIALGDEMGFSEHDAKPWVAFLGGLASAGGDRVVLFDYVREEAIHEFRANAGERYVFEPTFIPKRNQLAMSKTTPAGPAVELWNIDGSPTLERVVPGIVFGYRSNASPSGRVASLLARDRPNFTVLDLDLGRTVYAFPPTDSPPPTAPATPHIYPILSPGGRAVYFGPEYALVDVATGKVLWRPGRCERPGPFVSPEGFCVGEMWWELLGLAPSLDDRLVTYACRSLEDGSLIHRTRTRFYPHARDYSRDGRYVIAFNDGWVCRNGLLVNWPLLALCQVILALPLILLWAILRWRRKRGMRMTSARA